MALAAPQAQRFDGVWTMLPIVILAGMLGLAAPPVHTRLVEVCGQFLAWFGPLVGGLTMMILGVVWSSRVTDWDGHPNGALLPQGLRVRLPLVLAPGAVGGAMAFMLWPGSEGLTSVDLLQWGFTLFIIALMLACLGRLQRIAPERDRRGGAGEWRDYLAMTKPGLNGLVLITTFVGFDLAMHGRMESSLCLRVLFGTWLTAGGASTLNQYAERALDARMRRTADRPLPRGRIAPLHAFTFGVALAVTGLLTLALTVNILTAALGALSLSTYLFLYTPLKRINTLSTLAGAISGALPPVMGWTGAGGRIGPAALTLFFILFLWQIPHFLAIAWKYRADYGAAGYPLYSVLDPGGHATGRQALLYAGTLLPISLLTTQFGQTGALYLGAAYGLGLVFVLFALVFAWRPTPAHARALFFASIAYLPLLLGFMLADQVKLQL